MFKIEDETIHCTRGDAGNIVFSCKNSDGTDYTFNDGQYIEFKAYTKGKPEDVVISKKVNATNGSTTVIIPLTEAETKIGGLISKPIKYEYEISIDGNKTVIGHDENGIKQFILYPEGGGDDI